MGGANLRVAPIDVGLLGSGGIDVPPLPLTKRIPAGRLMSQRPQQLPYGAADEGVCIPRSRGPEDMGAVQKLGGVFCDESRPPGRLNQPLEEVSLKPPLPQLAAKAAQHGSVEALILEPETEGVFPSQVETHALLGLRVGAVVMVLEE